MTFLWVIRGFWCGVNEHCGLLELHAACNCSFPHTFRNNLSIPPTRVKQSLKIGRTGEPETSTINYHSALRKIRKERRSQWHFFVCILTLQPGTLIYDIIMDCGVGLLRKEMQVLCIFRNPNPEHLGLIFLYLNSLFVTICPETFSNLCFDSVRGM